MTSPKYERIFDGRKFIFAMVFASKKDAQEGKERLKKRGLRARIIKVGPAYILYKSK